MALLMAACNDDDNTNTTPSLEGTFQTFVTYEGGESGSTFTVTEPGTNVLTTFTSTKNLSSQLKVGERVVIYYKNSSDKRYQSGAIDLRGVSKIFDSDVAAKPQPEISQMVVDMIDVQTIELSGNYINVVAQAETNQPLLFNIWFDEETVDSDTPVGYVVFRTDVNSIERVIMGSFDASSVVSKSSCRNILLHYNTMSGEKTVTFNTGTQSIQPVEPVPAE